MLTDDTILKWAHNAQFERVCLSRFLGLPAGKYLSPTSWQCTMVWCAYLGLPLTLEKAGEVLMLEQQKMAEGKELIKYFCKPHGNRNFSFFDQEKWSQFVSYNRCDVEVEMAIAKKLSKFPVPDEEWKNYTLDQQINDRGIRLDMPLVQQAVRCDELSKIKLMAAMRDITGLDNPNSVTQMKDWLEERGVAANSLDKKHVTELIKTAPPEIAEALSLRQKLAKSSVSKYKAMESGVCFDDRVRGMFKFYGSHTGRFTGKLIQVQNLPQTHCPTLDAARALVRQGNFKTLEASYDSVPAILSELIRTAFISKEGWKFIVGDFSSIERIVLAWLAGEKWVSDAYAAKKDLYIATAAQMFNVPIETLNKQSPLRQKGKTADLACGYQGSVGALIKMGALESGLKEDELKPLVDAWRKANPHITKYWHTVNNATIKAVKDRTSVQINGITFEYQSGFLFITLPSGRRLAYAKPRVEPDPFGGMCVGYDGIYSAGIGSGKKWGHVMSYGGKFCENITQAISRDLLCFAMQNLDKVGYHIVMHVHDEVVLETPLETSTETIFDVMSETPAWTPGLILRADGFSGFYYKKE
ncbi:DNA polymerase [Clostridia bacterium]|nr:DNA polymerase [Clostridia bacterium]